MRTYTFSVEDKEYTLKYDFNAICEIEDSEKTGISALLGGDRVGYSTIRLILWGGLRWKNAGLTKQAVGYMITKYMNEGGDLEELVNNAVSLITEVRGMKAKKDDEDESGNE